MEIVGTVLAPIGLALFAIVVTQGVKEAIPEHWHKFIPLPLAAVCVGAGLLWSQFGETIWWQGAMAGLGVAALAAWGWDVFDGLRKGGGDS